MAGADPGRSFCKKSFDLTYSLTLPFALPDVSLDIVSNGEPKKPRVGHCGRGYCEKRLKQFWVSSGGTIAAHKSITCPTHSFRELVSVTRVSSFE